MKTILMAMFLLVTTFTFASPETRGEKSAARKASPQFSAESLEDAMKAATEAERAETRRIYVQEKKETEKIQADKTLSDSERLKRLKQTRKDSLAKRNAIRLRVRTEFRARYLESRTKTSDAGAPR